MAQIPSKVANRLVQQLKRFQGILNAAKSRDVGESDTVTIVVDILADIFGYDKYHEVTSEHAIRGTYCDLATTIDGVLQMLIEVKAIGIELKDQHVKQAVDYAANQGVDWTILTNGQYWKVYKVTFEKPINQELVIEFDLLAVNPRDSRDLAQLFVLCKEGIVKSALGDLHQQRQALSRFFLAAVVLSEPVVAVIRRELRKVSPDARIDLEEISNVLVSEVIKREVMEGDKATEAKRKINRTVNKPRKSKQTKTNLESSDGSSESEVQPGVGVGG